MHTMAPDDDPYTVLGIPTTATHSDVKHAYRALARTLHPDVNPDGELLFKQVTEAYRLLSSALERAKFDERAGLSLWQQLFSDQPFAQMPAVDNSYRVGALEKDGTLAVCVSLPEAVCGTQVTVAHPGTGQRRIVHIPAGTTDGATVRAGEEIIICRVAPHPLFTMDDGANLHITVPVTAEELQHGGPITAPTVGANPVKVRIPAGTAPEGSIRVRGRGVLVHGTEATDLFISFKLTEPDPVKAPEAFGRARTTARAPRPSAADQRVALVKAARSEQVGALRR